MADHPAATSDEALDGRILIARGAEAACRVVLLAPDRVLIATDLMGRAGQQALCYLARIGALPGRIGEPRPQGFVLNLSLGEVRAARIAARLQWQEDLNTVPVEQRADPRIVPRHRDVAVRLPDGATLDGRIENLSKSGALLALAAPGWLSVGSPVTVGKRHAAIVRFEVNAIAVRFTLPFCDDTFHPAIVV